MKNFLLSIFIFFAATASAQRDINHWQLSLVGGGFYVNESLSNTLEDIEEPGFYTLGIRVQKRLCSDFQIGLSFLENRLRDDFDVSVRVAELNLAYNWDNGYLLSERASVSPYHLVSGGFRSRGLADNVNTDNLKGSLFFENGVKVRLGDNWSTQVGFVLNWNGNDESFSNVFDSGYNYGGQVGVSYHFGKVRTTYKGAVFNAGRDFGQSQAREYNFESLYAYVTLNHDMAKTFKTEPSLTVDSLMAQRGMTRYPDSGAAMTVKKNDKVYQLLGSGNKLDSIYSGRDDILRLSYEDLDRLKQIPDESSWYSEPRSTEDTEEDDLIESQNRLIENQNEFIRLLLSTKETTNSPIRMKSGSGASGSKEKDNLTDRPVYTRQDSIAMMRVISVDSAHVTQWAAPSTGNAGDTIRLMTDDSAKMSELERRLDLMERENERLRTVATAQKQDSLQILENSKMNSLPADTVYIKDRSNREEIDRMKTQLEELRYENEKFRNDADTVGKGQTSDPSMFSTTDTIYLEREKDIEEMEEMLERLEKLERENDDLRKRKENDRKEKNGASETDQSLLDETRRQNDLLEEQIKATQKLADKKTEPTQVVIEDERGRNRDAVNVQPSVILPVGGNKNNSDKSDELIENQEQMQARLDSMERELAAVKAAKVQQTEAKKDWKPLPNLNEPTNVEAGVPDTMGTDSIEIGVENPDLNLPEMAVTSADSLTEDREDTLMEAEVPSEPLETVVPDSLPVPVANDSDDELDKRASALEPGIVYPVSVYFGLNSSNLTVDDKEKLKDVVDDLNRSPEWKVVLEGHTDKSGNASYNEMLSKKRATAVLDFLVANGLSGSRISIDPLGSKNADEAYNVNSRRVDIEVK